MEDKTLAKIISLGLLYLAASFIGGSWDPMMWHWVGKLFVVLFALGIVSAD